MPPPLLADTYISNTAGVALWIQTIKFNIISIRVIKGEQGYQVIHKINTWSTSYRPGLEQTLYKSVILRHQALGLVKVRFIYITILYGSFLNFILLIGTADCITLSTTVIIDLLRYYIAGNTVVILNSRLYIIYLALQLQ
jgi:hypothetical protein